MAYSTGAAPYRIGGGAIGRVSSTSVTPVMPTLWMAASTDALATVNATSYWSNGFELGLRKHDIIIYHDLNTPLTHVISVTAQTTNAGVTTSSLLTT